MEAMGSVLGEFDSIEDAETYRRSCEERGWENTAVLDKDSDENVSPTNAPRKPPRGYTSAR